MLRRSLLRNYSVVGLLALVLSALPVAAQEAPQPQIPASHVPPAVVGASGGEILWDSWGVPHIFANDAEKPRPALRLRRSRSYPLGIFSPASTANDRLFSAGESGQAQRSS